MFKIIWSQDRLIFNMGIPILIGWYLYIETAPGYSCNKLLYLPFLFGQDILNWMNHKMELQINIADGYFFQLHEPTQYLQQWIPFNITM